MRCIDQFVLGMLLCGSVSLQALSQKYHETPLGGKGYPDFLFDYENLARYSYNSKHDIDGLKQLFQIDTVSWDEMREHYDRYANVAPPVNVYDGKDSVSGIWKMLMVHSPLSDAPVKEVRSERGVWKYPPLQLVDLQDKNGKSNEKLFERLYKKMPRKSEYRNIYQSDKSRQIYPEWYNGSVTLLRDPKYYMGFVVSASPYFFHYDNGRPKYIISGINSGAPDFYSSLSLILDGDWAAQIPDGMYRFSLYASGEIVPRPSRGQKEIRFTWLLTIDTKGRQDAHLLSPEAPDGETLRAFKGLRTFVRRLRPGIFRMLYTSDGRLLPGRYLKALYDERGWLIEDLLQGK